LAVSLIAVFISGAFCDIHTALSYFSIISIILLQKGWIKKNNTYNEPIYLLLK